MYCLESANLPTFDGYTWNLISKLSSLLKVFYKTTVRLSERNCLVSEIIPQTVFLNRFVSKASTDPRFSDLSTTLNALKVSLDSRFKRYLKDYNVLLSTFLDPRYKTHFFNDNADDIVICKVSLSNSNIESQLVNTYEKVMQLKEE